MATTKTASIRQPEGGRQGRKYPKSGDCCFHKPTIFACQETSRRGEVINELVSSLPRSPKKLNRAGLSRGSPEELAVRRGHLQMLRIRQRLSESSLCFLASLPSPESADIVRGGVFEYRGKRADQARRGRFETLTSPAQMVPVLSKRCTAQMDKESIVRIDSIPRAPVTRRNAGSSRNVTPGGLFTRIKLESLERSPPVISPIIIA